MPPNSTWRSQILFYKILIFDFCGSHLIQFMLYFLVGVVLKAIKMEGQDLRMRQSGLDLVYLKSVPGLLKITEIVCNYMF